MTVDEREASSRRLSCLIFFRMNKFDLISRSMPDIRILSNIIDVFLSSYDAQRNMPDIRIVSIILGYFLLSYFERSSAYLVI